jgi:hypothetical protein
LSLLKLLSLSNGCLPSHSDLATFEGSFWCEGRKEM